MCVTPEISSAAHEYILFLVMICHLYTRLPKLRKSSTEWDIQIEMTIYRFPYVSQQSRLPLQSKESWVRHSAKPRGWFSSQLKQLAGFQFGSLHISLWCIGKTPEYVRHPHRTNRCDIRGMSHWSNGWARQVVFIGTRSHKVHLNDSLSSLFFLLVKSLWLLNMKCVTVWLYCPYPIYSSLIFPIIPI